MAVEVLTTDLETGQRERMVVHGNNYVLTCVGTAYIHHLNAFGNGTQVITVKGRDRVNRTEHDALPPLTPGASSAQDGETVHDVAATLVRMAGGLLLPAHAADEHQREVLAQLGRLSLFADVLDFPLDPETSGPTIREYVNGADA